MTDNPKLDKVQTGICGEFYAAAELARRNYNVSLTFGNTKAIDLLVEKNGSTFSVQVKAIQSKKSICWNISYDKIDVCHYYILVQLNADEVSKGPEFFPVSGFFLKQIIKRVNSGRDYIDYNLLKKYNVHDNWSIFNLNFNNTPRYNLQELESYRRALKSYQSSEIETLIQRFHSLNQDLKDEFNFDWINWKEGETLVTTSFKVYNALPLNVLLVLLYSIHRAEKFTENTITTVIKNGVLEKIISAIVMTENQTEKYRLA